MGAVLVLRTVAASMTSPDESADGVSANSFYWPQSGRVECQDWDTSPRCGHGLHGLRWGVGTASLLKHDIATRRWQVVECEDTDVVDITDGSDIKCKFRAGSVVYCGDRDGAIALVQASSPTPDLCVCGTAKAGYAGAATAGAYGTATAGAYGTAKAGAYGAATAGYAGTAKAGARGTATAGYDGILQIRWWDGNRYRIATFYVGEDGIEPDVAYRVDDDGKPIKATEAEP